MEPEFLSLNHNSTIPPITLNAVILLVAHVEEFRMDQSMIQVVGCRTTGADSSVFQACVIQSSTS